MKHAADRRITRILRWYRTHGRDLPWRKTRDPYRIFVSEVMLQQTQVARVIDYYERWIKRFPTWRSLAKAKTDALIRAWAGLGYNRRTLYMRDAAQHVTRDGVPTSIDEWKRLKGVGSYTAAAIYAFTTHKPAAAIDTNIRRVIGRLYFGKAHPAPPDDMRVARVLKRASNHELLYALMDLGALVCSSSVPKCADCPLRKSCKAAPKFLGSKKVRKRKKVTERIHRGKKFPDRIYRGRILSLVRTKQSVRLRDIGPRIDTTFTKSKDEHWIRTMVERMVRDGLLHKARETVSLPKT